MKLRLFVFVSILISCGPSPQDSIPSTGAAQMLEQQAVGLLAARCAACHGPDSPARAGINFITDPVQLVDRSLVVPGRPESSPLYQVVSSNRMPATGPLTAQEKDLLRRWILEL